MTKIEQRKAGSEQGNCSSLCLPLLMQQEKNEISVPSSFSLLDFSISSLLVSVLFVSSLCLCLSLSFSSSLFVIQQQDLAKQIASLFPCLPHQQQQHKPCLPPFATPSNLDFCHSVSPVSWFFERHTCERKRTLRLFLCFLYSISFSSLECEGSPSRKEDSMEDRR